MIWHDPCKSQNINLSFKVYGKSYSNIIHIEIKMIEHNYIPNLKVSLYVSQAPK